MEREEELLKRAKEHGFTAVVIDTDKIICKPEYRKYCEDNLCGNYHQNYACPPYCGTPEEMEEKIRCFTKAMVLQTNHSVKDAMDPVETKPLKKIHNQETLRLIRESKEGLLESGYRAIMAGPCSLCSQCHMQTQTPCPMEADRVSCLSAYCIDVVALAKAAGLEISWALDQAAFFSILLFQA